MAQRALPETSSFFLKGVQGGHPFEAELRNWAAPPPYAGCEVDTSTPEQHQLNTSTLIELVHGRNWMLEFEKNRCRRERLMQMGLALLQEELVREYEGALEEWTDIHRFMQVYVGSVRETSMGYLHLHWIARTVFHLYNLHLQYI